MKVFEVNEENYNKIVRIFHGEVFRRKEGGKFLMKLDMKQQKICLSLGIELKDHKDAQRINGTY